MTIAPSRQSSVLKDAFAVVIGSGFAGSLLSWILAKHGRRVVMIDKASHPRFAIGESSTPTADFLLAYLSQRWGLPELAPLAAFGTWQAHYPELRCGLKRGFSYFGHRAGCEFYDDESNSRSLLVAASATDDWSDTHWYRADVDAWLAQKACNTGAELYEHATVQNATWDPVEKRWDVRIQVTHANESESCNAQFIQIRTNWLIDAAGSGNATGDWCGHQSDSDWMRTRSSAIFGHFESVASFSQSQSNYESDVRECFDSDNAAQHHVTEDAWYWMLRFQGNTTSVGLVEPNSLHLKSSAAVENHWRDYLLKYPSVAKLMADATQTQPTDSQGKVQLAYVARMSRCRSHAAGTGWILLPVAYGFIDPLHSSGIAHSLSGVARIAECLLGKESHQTELLSRYNSDMRTELEWLDTLVSGCYQGLPSFECFSSFAAFYFAATIAFEKQLANAPDNWPMGFLNAKDMPLRDSAEQCWQIAAKGLESDNGEKRFTETVRSFIEPWNRVGLLDPFKKNRLTHTAPPKRAVFMGKQA